VVASKNQPVVLPPEANSEEDVSQVLLTPPQDSQPPLVTTMVTPSSAPKTLLPTVKSVPAR